MFIPGLERLSATQRQRAIWGKTDGVKRERSDGGGGAGGIKRKRKMIKIRKKITGKKPASPPSPCSTSKIDTGPRATANHFPVL